MLSRLLAPAAEPVFAVMRIVVGLLFAFHGMQKVFGVLSEYQPAVGSQLWIGGVIELVTGLLIAAGLFTAWAAFLASGTMAVAYVQFHWKFAFGASFWPNVNQGEPALVYALLFLYIACRGPDWLAWMANGTHGLTTARLHFLIPRPNGSKFGRTAWMIFIAKLA